MKLYLRETGDIPTAVIALEILPHVICRKMNELHFIFIVYETFFCFCFWNKKNRILQTDTGPHDDIDARDYC